jgi:hypothetical protein
VRMALLHVHAGGRRALSFPPLCLQGSRVGPALAALTSAPSTLLPSTPLESHMSHGKKARAHRGPGPRQIPGSGKPVGPGKVARTELSPSRPAAPCKT